MADIIKITKALSDEHRFNIVKTLLEQGEISCSRLTELFPLAQPTISYHLRVLQESGLIQVRKEGQWSYFSVNRQALEKFLNALQKEFSNTN
ncbi:MAG: ArsR family transcriptional regulator [Calditrichaeota bacterium]|nr:MAG: ArsR family transcriptional regulator [Calditrichota bacterium]